MRSNFLTGLAEEVFRRVFSVALVAVLMSAGMGKGWAEAEALEPFRQDERVLILAPHPDDEAIACAGVIQQAKKAGARIKIVYLTNGDNNEFAFMVYEKRPLFIKSEFIYMGKVRMREAIRAMKLLGLQEEQLIFLGYPDFGTYAIFSRYWQAKAAYKSMLTRSSSVPYKAAFSFGAPYTGESILSDLKKIILDYKPERVFVSHPADTNGDHRALYLFTQIALRDLRKQIPRPKVHPYLVHCPGWPKPRHYHPELDLEPPESFKDAQISWSGVRLSPQELERKHQAILSYFSQTRSSAFYLLSFARKQELFGDYPEITLERQASHQENALKFFGFSPILARSQGKEAVCDDCLIEVWGKVSYAAAGDYLFILIDKDKELLSRFSLIVDLFGYSDQAAFSAMPKIRIVAHHEKTRVYDGKRMIEPGGVRVYLSRDEVLLRIPLAVLGNPDFMLSSVRTYGGPKPAATGFRRIVLK
ncbi:MAG: PIG-L family deacetylase [Candidatus Omnitrophota bacterium]